MTSTNTANQGQQQQHPREMIADLIRRRQQLELEGENPIKGWHICLMMLSIITALCIIAYEMDKIMKKNDDNNDKWIKAHSASDSHSPIRYLNDIKQIRGESFYDYIIIGAGTAGSVLASRLARAGIADVDTDTFAPPRVLVIESKSIAALIGENNNDHYSQVTAFNKVYKREQWTINSNNAHNAWLKSSAKRHNNHVWSIGHPLDYDKLWNLPHWRWNEHVLPHFTRSERVLIDEIVHEFGVENKTQQIHEPRKRPKMGLMQRLMSMLPIAANRDYDDQHFGFGGSDVSKNRGDAGPMFIKQARSYSMANAFIVNALNEGYTYNVDQNSFFNHNEDEENPLLNTVSYQQYYKYDTFEAYIHKYRKSNRFMTTYKNKVILDVLTETTVSRILFHDRQKGGHNKDKHIAVGVQVMHKGMPFDIDLRDDYEQKNEIILSAGTIRSPQLLMLSGFGDAEHLQSCCGKEEQIRVIEHNTEIGKHLRDQIKFTVYFKPNPKYQVLSKYEIGKWKYKWFRGTLVNSSGLDANLYYTADPKDRGIPQLQLVMFNGIQPINVYNYSDKAELCMNTAIIDGVSIDVVLLHPKSTGFVRLKSSDPFDAVNIEPNHLFDEHDLELLYKGYEHVKQIFVGKPPFDGDTTFGPFWPCGDLQGDAEKIKQYIRNNVRSNHNYVGSNRMGVVVDEQTLILNATFNVRVVDSSVMPSFISGIGIDAPTIMIAEKAAAVILEARTKGASMHEYAQADEREDTAQTVTSSDHSEL